jgi:biopolymer transport protein ExbD
MNKARKALLIIFLVLSGALTLFYVTVNKVSSLPPVSADIQEAGEKDFKNSVILKKDNAVVIIDGKAKNISYENLQDEFALYAEKLKSREVSIIGASDGDYKKIVDVLDLMAMYKIPKYKMKRSALKSKDI